MFIKFYTNSRRIAAFVFITTIILVSGCDKGIKTGFYKIDKSLISEKGMVVSAHSLASDVGVEILKKGGNAVDAIVAVQFALAVVYPRAGNIGGGGFMVIRNPDGSNISLDYREKAPMQAYKDMYLDSLGNVIKGLSRTGGLAVGVPGSVAGLITAWKKYGAIKDFKKIIQPAIDLARHGFALSKAEVNRLNRFKERFIAQNQLPMPFVKDTEWKVGDRLVQKDLAHTLELIRDNGIKGFYEGENADRLVAQMKKSNGIITKGDLKAYQAKWRKPIYEKYKNYKIISMPPPSSGGIALAQMLKMVAGYPIKKWGFHSTETIHLMTEIERRVYADRAKYLGDEDFYKVPKKQLLGKEYLRSRMKDFTPEKATPSEAILAGSKVMLESFETTHTSVVDKNKMAVSITTTLNSNFGSKVMVAGGGYFLNNEMDDFSAKPGVPNQFGLVGAEANAIQPGKRMLSSMTPTIIEKDGKLFMVLGTPGGSTIMTSVFQVFLNVAEFEMNLKDAVNAKRFHHQWLPDEIFYEKGAIDDKTMEELRKLGHHFKNYKYIGLVKAIRVLPDGRLQGVGDNRSEDDAEGW